MQRRRIQAQSRRSERGTALAELAIGALVFFIAVFGILELGRLLWTHNALTDAARRGARYASMNSQNTTKVKNLVVYGNANGGTQPVVYNLTTNNVSVTYSGFGVKQGTVTVQITGYQFVFNVPLIGATITLPAYKTTLMGESAGYVPATI